MKKIDGVVYFAALLILMFYIGQWLTRQRLELTVLWIQLIEDQVCISLCILICNISDMKGESSQESSNTNKVNPLFRNLLRYRQTGQSYNWSGKSFLKHRPSRTLIFTRKSYFLHIVIYGLLVVMADIILTCNFSNHIILPIVYIN